MTGPIANRLDALEASSPQQQPTVHELIWDDQSFDELLDNYGRDRIAPGDLVILTTLVPHHPIVARDRPKWEAWAAEQNAAWASSPNVGSRRSKGRV